MSISQLIFTTTCANSVMPKTSHQLAYNMIEVCGQMNITGRVFADHRQALAIIEGPTEFVHLFHKAVSQHRFVEASLLHTDREIKIREFSDCSVWLNFDAPMEFSGGVHYLTTDSFAKAMPPQVSARVRIMIEAYLKPYLKAA